MADESSTKLPVIPEIIPSQASHVSGLGRIGGPFVFADWIGNHGHNGVATFTLEAQRNMTVGDKTVQDRVIVAHLRMPIHTMRLLKNSIEQVELLLNPTASEEKN